MTFEMKFGWLHLLCTFLSLGVGIYIIISKFTQNMTFSSHLWSPSDEAANDLKIYDVTASHTYVHFDQLPISLQEAGFVPYRNLLDQVS